MEKGNTHYVLMPFIKGMEKAGAEIELLFSSQLSIKPCSCGIMHCWYRKPGICYIQDDDMKGLYPKLADSDLLVWATPVYAPIPGEMQHLLNRLCPLLIPDLRNRDGRTRSRFRTHVRIQRIALVTTGGWWEKENANNVVQIMKETAANAGVPFAGAAIRPHAHLIRSSQISATPEARSVIDALEEAGFQLVREGFMINKTLEAISQPLISEEDLRALYNQWVESEKTMQ
jgi:multimeric flavodoxin WrbA